MAYPPAYTRTYSFTDWETLHPDDPKPGPQLDAEYDGVSNALTATQTALALIQRADGALANDSVGEDQLQDGIFDGIADGITADAEAAAAAAQASATAAATSASQASASAASASASAATASGAAAQAGVSQGIAQSAANDASLSNSNAFDNAQIAANAGNEAQGFRNEAEGFADLAFDWAEQLEGPVMPAPPGWPEAVDDGMFSSKWWAIRARDYNSTETIDLGDGTGQADIGEGFDDWDAIPGNDIGVGQVYATWGTPTQTYVLIDRSNPSDPASWQNITGGPGPPGPANDLDIGTVTTGAPGSAALADITGTPPNQILNLTIPRGDVGATGAAGPAGPPNALAVGTTTTGAPGSAAVVAITGTSPTQTIDFTIPRGDTGAQGIQGIQGIQGPAGPPVNMADPTAFVTLVNQVGDSTAAMRSDAAPPLSQAIAPTWTAQHIFALNGALAPNGSSVKIAANPPYFEMRNTAAPANQGRWINNLTSTNWQLFATDDAGTVANIVMRAVRNAAAVTDIQFGNATNNPTFNFLGTGSTTFHGLVTVEAPTTFPRLAFLNSSAGNYYIGGDGTASNDFTLSLNAGVFLRVNTVGQLLLGDGAAGQPIFSFINDPDTGIYRAGANTFVIAVNGAPQLVTTPAVTYVNAGVFNVPDGTAAAPAIAFNLDSDTGIYRPALDQIGFSAGGVLRMIVSGAVSLTVPFWAMDGTAGTPGISFASDTNTGFFREAADMLSVTSGGTVLARYLGLAATSLPRTWFPAPVSLMDGTASAPAIFFETDIDTGFYRWGVDAFAATSNGQPVMSWRLGQSRINDGTPTGPALTFENDSDTGMYRYATNTGALSAGGSVVFIWDPGRVYLRGNLLAADGSASEPGYTFENDSNTGLYRNGPDAMRLVSGAVAKIGITLSGCFMAIDGINGGVASPYLYFDNDTDTGVYRIAADNFGIAAGGVQSASFTSAGVSAASFTTTSARAGKRETGAPKYAADILSRLRPILYRLLAGDDREQLGLIAEEVHEVCPQLSDGKTVSYDRLALLLLADWQESRAAA